MCPTTFPRPRKRRRAKNSSDGPTRAALADTTEARFQAAIEKKTRGSSPSPQTVAFGDQPSVTVPDLSGQSVRGVTETCERLGMIPALIGDGVALEQSPGAGAQILRGSRVDGSLWTSGRGGAANAQRSRQLRLVAESDARPAWDARGHGAAGDAEHGMKKREKTLGEVLAGIEILQTSRGSGAAIRGIACDSRRVAPGALFFALPGNKDDGNRFVDLAIAAGAMAIASGQARPAEFSAGVAWIELVAGQERRALAIAAANFYDHPADGAAAGRRHRNKRQDDDQFFGGFDPARGRSYGGAVRHDWLSHAARQPHGGQHHSRIARPAGNVRGGSRAGGTHAVLEASSHALAHGPSVGLPFRGGDFHESHARSSRFSQNFRRLFRRQAPPV